MKTSKSFRLSLQALESLAYLTKQTGSNETAILENAIAFYRQAYQNAQLPPEPVIGKIEPDLKPKKRRRRR